MTGWTWDQVDELTLPRLHALLDSWETQPPAAVSLMRLAIAAGAWKPTARRAAPPKDRPQLTREEIIASFGGMPMLVETS